MEISYKDVPSGGMYGIATTVPVLGWIGVGIAHGIMGNQ